MLLLLLTNARISIASASASASASAAVVVVCRVVVGIEPWWGFWWMQGIFDCKYFPIESARKVTCVINFVTG